MFVAYQLIKAELKIILFISTVGPVGVAIIKGPNGRFRLNLPSETKAAKGRMLCSTSESKVNLILRTIVDRKLVGVLMIYYCI